MRGSRTGGIPLPWASGDPHDRRAHCLLCSAYEHLTRVHLSSMEDTSVSRGRSSGIALTRRGYRLCTTQSAPHHLPGRGRRQLAPELDQSRILVGGQSPADEILELARELGRRRDAGSRHDHRLDHFGANRIGNTDHGCQRNSRVLHQTTLDLSRSDPVAGDRDKFIVAVDAVDIAWLVPHHLTHYDHSVSYNSR